jgi:lipopolysaccharide/colanic/teichoic acid biosynthesis glycosyltransferase
VSFLIQWVEIGSSPIFIQKRPGKDESPFNIIKLKTMNETKDSDGNLLPDNFRITRFGRFFRSASIDELPQLINVLKGDMSFVGPRPLLMEYLNHYNE